MDPLRPAPRLLVASLFVALAGLLAAPAVRAQQASADAADAAARATQAMERIDREIACLRTQRERLARLHTLIAEADTQARASSHGARERDEGAAAVASLRAQAADAERAAKLCLEPGAAFATGETMQVAVTPPHDPVAARLAQPNGTATTQAAHLGATGPTLAQDTARLIERDTGLSDDVRVLRGVHTGGSGTLEHGAVRAAVRAIGPRIAACYDRMLERGALREGTLALVFDVTGIGRPTRVSVTRTDHGDHLDDVALGQCVRQAGEALRFPQGARGGTATYTYTLQFGG